MTMTTSDDNMSVMQKLSQSLTMISQEHFENEYIPMRPRDRMICVVIADIIIVQCILVFAGSASVLVCAWKPDSSTMDFDKLARIMYLFDFEACVYKLKRSKEIMTDIRFNNDTRGLTNIRPIQWRKTKITVSTRLSAKTRMYIIISLSFHCIWLVLALGLRIFSKNSSDPRSLKIALAIFFYSLIFMIFFDVSMSLVYISHIKQSLTKGMVLRYSGWSFTIKLKSYEEFAGWLPIAASICWIRGVFILFLNAYCCRTINLIMKKIKRREIKMKYDNEKYTVIPDPRQIRNKKERLVFRVGEMTPSTTIDYI